MISFENSGTLDLRSIKIIGLSAKETDNPIGYFGTGFKYAIAILLNNHHTVTIQPGDGTSRKLHTKNASFRHTEYSSIWLDDEELPFTSHLGHSWEFWQSYRELYSNCLDENGKVNNVTFIPPAKQDVVRIIVQGAAFEKVHYNRDRYFWNHKNEQQLGEYVSRSRTNPGIIFYKGIRVGEFKDPTNYSYNIFNTQMELSEDRLLTPWWQNRFSSILSSAVKTSSNEEFITEMLRPAKNTMESQINLSWFGYDFEDGELFETLAMKEFKRKAFGLNFNVLEEINLYLKQQQSFDAFPLTSHDEKIVETVIKQMNQFSMDITQYDVVWNAKLDENTLGCVHNDIIYIGKLSFDRGARDVLSTAIEEFIHRDENAIDYSRDFQDSVLRKLARAIEVATEDMI